MAIAEERHKRLISSVLSKFQQLKVNRYDSCLVLRSFKFLFREKFQQ